LYAVSRSRSAQRVIEDLIPPLLEEYEEIEYHLQALPALLNDGRLVSPCRFYELDGYRYFDEIFPFVIYFETKERPEVEVATLLIQAILATTLDHPTQVQI
jgi:hypothetical protein